MATIIFDGDNTLWPCNEYYAAAKEDFVVVLQRELPQLLKEEILAMFSKIDVAATKGPLGFTQERFPTSMKVVYKYFCGYHGTRENPLVTQEVYDVGKSVFDASCQLPPVLVGGLGCQALT